MAVQYQRRLIRKLVVVNPFIALVSHASLLVSCLLCITFTSFLDPKSCCAASFGMGKSVSSSRISNAQSRGVSTIKCQQPSTRTTATATVALFSSVDGIRSSVKGILFDIDGTLANSWRLGYDATQVVLQNNGIAPITEDIYHDHTRYCTPDRMARHAGYVPEDGPKFIAVGQKLGKEFDDLYVNLVSTETAGFYHGVEELLCSLPGHIKLGALTNACVAYAEAVLRVNNNLKDRFLTVHGADSVPAPKPMPDGLLLCCNELGLDPSTCIYIGDSPSDAMAAQAAGMPSIGVLWGSHSKSSLLKAPFLHVCSTIEELQSVLPKR